MNTAHKYGVPAQIVLFDLGRVLLDWDPDRLYQKLILDPVERHRFLSTICTMAWHTKHDAGTGFAENAQPLIEKYPDQRHFIEAWGERWLEMFDGYIEGVPALIHRLEAEGLPLFALTNMPSSTWEEMKTHFSHLQRFRDIIISGDEKCVKPDPKIYQIALTRMGSPAPETVLFIDDSRANIEAADTLGFQTHLFTSAQSLETDLMKRHLIG